MKRLGGTRTAVLAFGWISLAFATASACTGRDTRATAPKAQGSTGSAPVAPLSTVPSAAPPAAGPVTQSEHPATLAEPPPESQPQQVDPPGSTRGTIACGQERCTAGKQVCALDNLKWHCIEGQPASSALYCDDGTDCGPGLTCCDVGASSERAQLCSTRHGPTSRCAFEVCKPGGAACPRGKRCDEDACVPDLAVTCPGSALGTCGKQELCEWKAGKSACVTDPKSIDHEEERGVFACTRPQDCPSGDKCCTSMSDYWKTTGCGNNCDIANSTLVCNTAKDCTAILWRVPQQWHRKAKLRCEPVGDGGPAWLKACKMDLPADF